MGCCNNKTYTIGYCPNCQNVGEEVKIKTVKSIVKNEIVVNDDADYHLCLSSYCDVAYFNNHNTPILKSKLKVPIWFKQDTHPKYICYCSKVNEDEIIDAIINKNCRTVKDIVDKTNAMNISNCIENSPTGKCCSRQISELLNKIIS